ncbi:MAG TPA: hypothetical protein VHN20_04265 [Beijerinckiaceae bacterium]|nr:hypothetical protein [Beijerinckiaceae bacterium]
MLAAVLIAGMSGAAPAQDVRRFDLAMKGGELAPQWRTLRVKQGDAVELRWTSDHPLNLHLHGYDIELRVNPGEPAIMAFKAADAGRFGLTTVRAGGANTRSHQHGGRVLYLEVHP